MHSAFPADEISDISDTFWASSPSLPMNRSASEWAFEQFLEEVVSAPAPPAATLANADQLTVSSVASAHSSTSKSKREEADEEVVEIKKPDCHQQPQHLNCPLPPPPSTASIDSDQYRELLKSKLDLACAAVALTRVITTLSLFFV